MNLRMSLCSARVRFRDSANVSPSSAGIPKRKHLFPKKETNALIYRPTHGKLMPVKLGGRCIDLLTGTWEINAGQIRVPAH